MKVTYFITKEMREKIWFEQGRSVDQANSVKIDPALLTPEARAALGFTTEIQMTLDEAIDVDPQHEEVVNEMVLAWLNAAPARKERLNLQYRLDDLEKKKRETKTSIRQMEKSLGDQEIERQHKYECAVGEAKRLRAKADEIEEVAEEQRKSWGHTIRRLENEINTDLKPALTEIESLMEQLKARYEDLGK